MKLSVSSFAEMPDDVHVPVEDHYETLSAEPENQKRGNTQSAVGNRRNADVEIFNPAHLFNT